MLLQQCVHIKSKEMKFSILFVAVPTVTEVFIGHLSLCSKNVNADSFGYVSDTRALIILYARIRLQPKTDRKKCLIRKTNKLPRHNQRNLTTRNSLQRKI